MNTARRSPGSLRTFLAAARKYLNTAVKEKNHVNFVVGNESVDLDSTTSAILYAYFNTASSTTTPPTIYIPLLNLPARDISIRPELLWLLPKVGLEPDCLITLDDVPGISCSEKQSGGRGSDGESRLNAYLTSFTLVDHNKLTGPLATLYSHDLSSTTTDTPSAQVIGCIDHHTDENFIPTAASPRIIRTAGSCTSLVLQHCRSRWDALSHSTSSVPVPAQAQAQADDAVRLGNGIPTSVGVEEAKEWDAQIAILAITSVLVDTGCLKDEGKTEDVDREAVEYLEGKILMARTGREWEWDREKFFEELMEAKGDLEGLSMGDVLRKDYKEWSEDSRDGEALKLGFASVVKPLRWLCDKAETNEYEQGNGQNKVEGEGQGGAALALMKEIGHFAEQRNLDLFAIGTTFTDEEQGEDDDDGGGAFCRELLVWTRNPEITQFVDVFDKKAGDELQLEEWKEKDLGGSGGSGESDGIALTLKAWRQRNLTASRKRVGPLLREVMKEL